MKPRDRMFVMLVSTAAVLVATWLVWVSPERSRASSLEAQVSAAQSTLASAQGRVVSAESDRAQYPIAYASLVSLGKAVPPESDVSSLLYQLDKVADSTGVGFASFTMGATAASSSSSAPGTAVVAGFQVLPFSISFNGSFFDLYRVLDRLNQFTMQNADGSLSVSGRLITIQSTSLSSSTPGTLEGTITADAYVLPPPTTTTAPSATASTPGATTPAAAAPASSTATPALVKSTG